MYIFPTGCLMPFNEARGQERNFSALKRGRGFIFFRNETKIYWYPVRKLVHYNIYDCCPGWIQYKPQVGCKERKFSKPQFEGTDELELTWPGLATSLQCTVLLERERCLNHEFLKENHSTHPILSTDAKNT